MTSGKDRGESRRGFIRQVSVGASLLTLGACQKQVALGPKPQAKPKKGIEAPPKPQDQAPPPKSPPAAHKPSDHAMAKSKGPIREPAPAKVEPGSQRPEAEADLPEGLSARHFVIHGTRPLNLETRREAFGSAWITPIDRAFLRANLPLPPASILEHPDAWELELSGVAKPGILSLASLRHLPLVTVAAVLQCSGNGRAYFPHKPSGSPWTVGAAANLVWTGVRVADVLRAMGGLLDRGAKYMTATGGEPIPPGLKAEQVMVQRSIPLKKALRDAILAWDVNGAPLSLGHGGPLRLVVPGYYGVNFVKYIKSIEFSRQESQAKIQKSSYRVRPVGQKGGPQHPTMGAMNVKSFLTLPADKIIKAGKHQLVGVAFAGENAIKKVEVSVDGGNSWRRASLVGPDLGPFAWRQFALVVDLPPGKHRLCSRAVDVRGRRQPRERVDNHRGYGNNSWQDMALEVEVIAGPLPKKAAPMPANPSANPSAKAPAPASAAPPQAPIKPGTAAKISADPKLKLGEAVFNHKAQPSCKACHAFKAADAHGTIGPNLDRLVRSHAEVVQAVHGGLGLMPAQKEILSGAEIDAVAHYVVTLRGGP